jgi:glutamine synthetase
MFEKRKDLMYSGRTLLGSKPPKGQELDDQYYGAIKPRVSAYMKDLNEELWKLGVPAKTEHNESAPAQHELASMYTTTNIATDHNQLIMEIMQSIAKEHGMICVLHEKPFEGISGSGKHNNWSLATSKGANLLDPGATPHENARFLLFLVAVIKAVDEYQDLLRISAASAGNDNRLGGYEAPPAILSVYLGDEINAILEAIENEDESLSRFDGKKDMMLIGETALPPFPKDTTDRNRTSPFAFTGDKFEFRMVGSAMSIAQANVVINTTVAESLRVFANELESATDFNSALHKLIKETISKHKRIIFNGNAYGDEWIREAKERGLMNLSTTPDALPHILSDKNIKLYEEHKVFTREELSARFEISLENYCNKLSIEAVTMNKLIKKSLLNVATNYAYELSRAALTKREFLSFADCKYETETVKRLSDITSTLHFKTQQLSAEIAKATETEDAHARAMLIKDKILPIMEEIREPADELELIIPRKDWPFPTYGDLLFSVR